VLTVTDGGETKMRNIAQAAYDVCGGVGAGRFLVTNVATLEGADPLELSWLDATGAPVRLSLSTDYAG
jgi:hypothetical protein